MWLALINSQSSVARRANTTHPSGTLGKYCSFENHGILKPFFLSIRKFGPTLFYSKAEKRRKTEVFMVGRH
jgi:hypothetical protein